MPYLWERDDVTGALLGAVATAATGTGSVSFIVGEAGLGKTSLVRLLQGQSPIRVGLGEAVAAEAALPFGLVSQALGGLEGFDELSVVEGLASAEMRAAFFYRTARWLEKTVADEPFLVLVDDLHWADPDSLGLLGFLCRRLASWRLAIVATMRPWPSDAQNLAEALTAQGRASTFDLEPLGPGAASAVLAEAASRELTRDESDNALGACAGNPFLLSQLGISLRTRAGGTATLGGRDGRLLVSRFGGLPADVLHVAQVASVVGARFRPSLVASAAEVDRSATEQAVRTMAAAGLARVLDDGQVEFVHPLFAKALYDDLPATTRALLHGQVMRALVTSGADPSLAAAHARAGHLVGDGDAIAVLEAAGRAALLRGGLESAVVDLRAAAEMAGNNASSQLLITLADTEVATGKTERAETVCRRLLVARPERLEQSQALTILARAAFVAGRPEEVERNFQAAIEAAGDNSDQQVAVLSEALATCSALLDPRRVLGWAVQARQLLNQETGLYRTVTDTAWAASACVTGDWTGVDAVLASLTEGRVAAAISGLPTTLAIWTAVCAHELAMMAERFAEAEEAISAGWARAEAVGSPSLIAYLGIAHADAQCRQGRLAEAHRLAEVVEAANSNLNAGLSAFTALPRALLALEMGDAGTAEAFCDLLSESLLKDMPEHCPIHWIWAWKVRAELALDKGQVETAADLAVRMNTRAASAGIVEPAVVPWADTAMAAFLRSGRYGDAEGLARSLETATDAWPRRWPRSVAEGGRAGLAEVRKEYQEAEDHHHRAIDLLEDVQLPLALVRALVGYGAFLRRSGRPAQARAPLGRAVEKAHACGASRLEDQALVQLHASGGRRGRWRGPELSNQEQRTAMLAAQGATNAEIAAALAVSVKTVEHYLSSTYTKLGIRSRHELPKIDLVSG